jgi:hypothetical protein
MKHDILNDRYPGGLSFEDLKTNFVSNFEQSRDKRQHNQGE